MPNAFRGFGNRIGQGGMGLSQQGNMPPDISQEPAAAATGQLRAALMAQLLGGQQPQGQGIGLGGPGQQNAGQLDAYKRGLMMKYLGGR